MKTDKKIGISKNSGETSKSKKAGKFNAIATEKTVNDTEANVSVFTKTTNPKVVIKSENLKEKGNISLQKCQNKHKILKLLCFIIICVIILITLFLTLKTYNTVKDLADYIIL